MRWPALLILFLLTVGYLFIGAAVFRELESGKQQGTARTVSDQRLVDFLKNATCVSRAELDAFVQGVLADYEQGVSPYNTSSEGETEEKWTFINAFYFSATIMTTIGYGHISPNTRNGQIFCIFYAFFGISLMGVFLVGVGGKLSKPIKAFKERSKTTAVRLVKSVVIGLLGFVILIVLPAIAFHSVEDWTFTESAYFSVITLTTVGFGDYVAAQGDMDYQLLYKILLVVWMFLGLAWVSICLSDVSDYLTDKVNTISDKRKSSLSRSQNQVDNPRPYGSHNKAFSDI